MKSGSVRSFVREINPGTVEWNSRLWKYFKMERFLSTLETGLVHFGSANQFADPFEGAVAVQTVEGPADPRCAEMELAEKAFFELKRLTKISCWHRADYESDAMWKLYAGENKGIAITTTPKRMRAAFSPFRLRPEYGSEDLWAGPVQYIDLTEVRMRGVGMLDRFFYKHRAFEWEREFRLAISLRGAEEFGVTIPSNGIFVEADLNVLIERIVLGSTTSPEERELVTRQVDDIGFSERLERSTLLGRPRYV